MMWNRGRLLCAAAAMILWAGRGAARSAAGAVLNLHGGGFRVDSGSLTESIPIASLTGIKVVSVLYRLAPEHPFPAAVNDQ